MIRLRFSGTHRVQDRAGHTMVCVWWQVRECWTGMESVTVRNDGYGQKSDSFRPSCPVTHDHMARRDIRTALTIRNRLADTLVNPIPVSG